LFRNMLVATDGSDLAAKAVEQGVLFAKEIGAKITAVTVTEPFHLLSLAPDQLEYTLIEYKKRAETHAEKVLGTVSNAAKTENAQSDDPSLATTRDPGNVGLIVSSELEMCMAEQRVTLAVAIQQLREQLREAAKGGEEEDLRFLPESVEVELDVKFSLEMEAGGGLKLWSILDLSGKAKTGDETTHKVKLILKPVDRSGNPTLIGSSKLER